MYPGASRGLPHTQASKLRLRAHRNRPCWSRLPARRRYQSPGRDRRPPSTDWSRPETGVDTPAAWSISFPRVLGLPEGRAFLPARAWSQYDPCSCRSRPSGSCGRKWYPSAAAPPAPGSEPHRPRLPPALLREWSGRRICKGAHAGEPSPGSFEPWSFLLAQIGGEHLAGFDDQHALESAASLFGITQRAESHFDAISRLGGIPAPPSGANEIAGARHFHDP